MLRILGVLGWMGITLAAAQEPPAATYVIPQGPLGKALGVKIEIVAVAGPSSPRGRSLSVTAVDGKPLEYPLPMEVRGKPLAPGKEYRLTGYQSAEFTGVPEWANPMVDTPFQFHPFFVVVSAVEAGP